MGRGWWSRVSTVCAMIDGFSCFIGAMKGEVDGTGAGLSVLDGHGDV